MGKETNEEQVTEPSAEEQVKEPSKIGGVKDALGQFEKAQAEKLASKTETKSEEETKEPSPTSEGEGGEETAPEAKLFITDKEGNKTPIVFKADGKYHAPDDPSKVITWQQHGIHSNAELESVKSEREEIAKAKPFLDMIQKAYDEGRITIDGKKIGEAQGEKPTEEEEVDETLDPEMAKMMKEMNKTKEEMKELKEHELKKAIESAKTGLETEITKHKKEQFAAYTALEGEKMPLRVWDLLAEQNTDGSPKHNVEQAMKMSHDSMIEFVKEVIGSHPDLIKDSKKEAVTEYLEDKEKKEKAPVGSPSALPAGSPPAAGEEKKFKGVKDAMEKAAKYFAEKEAAGQKS